MTMNYNTTVDSVTKAQNGDLLITAQFIGLETALTVKHQNALAVEKGDGIKLSFTDAAGIQIDEAVAFFRNGKQYAEAKLVFEKIMTNWTLKKLLDYKTGDSWNGMVRISETFL